MKVAVRQFLLKGGFARRDLFFLAGATLRRKDPLVPKGEGLPFHIDILGVESCSFPWLFGTAVSPPGAVFAGGGRKNVPERFNLAECHGKRFGFTAMTI